MPDKIENIKTYLGDHKPPYLYNHRKFEPGRSTVWYSGPYWDNEEISQAIQTLIGGTWITSGQKVYQFERAFAKRFNSRFGHMVNSGSSANLVMIAALKEFFGWEDQDEIIVSPVGFPTTISAIVQNNLKPVFVDIEWDTLNFDVDKISEKIGPRTKGIFVSPVLGNPPDFNKLLELKNEYNIHLIGDNCDSLGSKWNGKYLSDYYIAYSNSFYPAHHISTGEGGMVCTDIHEIKELVMSFSTWGRDCYCVGPANLLPKGTCNCRFSKWLEDYGGKIDHKYVFRTMGYNLKPLDLQGAIGLAQLNKLNEIERKRKKSYELINDIFKVIPYVRSVKILPQADPHWFGTPFICERGGLKHKLVSFLEENKIQTRNYFAGNILIHPGYKHLDNYRKYPEANKVLDKVFFIGAAPHYEAEHFSYIRSIVNKFIDESQG